MSDDAVLPREVLAEVRALRADVEALAARGRVTKADREMLAELFQAAAPVFGDKLFTTADVFGWSTLAPLVSDCTPSALSWTFARAANLTIAGFRIVRVGDDRGVALWGLRREVVTRASAGARGCVPMDPTDTDPET